MTLEELKEQARRRATSQVDEPLLRALCADADARMEQFRLAYAREYFKTTPEDKARIEEFNRKQAARPWWRKLYDATWLRRPWFLRWDCWRRAWTDDDDY